MTILRRTDARDGAGWFQFLDSVFGRWSDPAYMESVDVEMVRRGAVACREADEWCMHNHTGGGVESLAGTAEYTAPDP